MIKLYKKIGGELHFQEAWVVESLIQKHWGAVGSQGLGRQYEVDEELSEEENLKSVLQEAIEDGFEELDEEALSTLIIEFSIDGFGTEDQLEKRQALEEFMNELLGWTGLGYCDGGSSGAGTMEVCCFVVDYELAAGVVEEALDETQFSDFSKIYREEQEDA